MEGGSSPPPAHLPAERTLLRINLANGTRKRTVAWVYKVSETKLITILSDAMATSEEVRKENIDI